eukprot:TRINITY_DN65818_c7_g2_i1.p2 TRINITY_DN65818_c7_g2~~TRINITY_DN65818_c7_g2_i1.p2  ORF type:complete len:171 (-),score=6.88 TRINITY_DN65818_c7_g2_i1:481-993(-)
MKEDVCDVDFYALAVSDSIPFAIMSIQRNYFPKMTFIHSHIWLDVQQKDYTPTCAFVGVHAVFNCELANLNDVASDDNRLMWGAKQTGQFSFRSVLGVGLLVGHRPFTPDNHPNPLIDFISKGRWDQVPTTEGQAFADEETMWDADKSSSSKAVSFWSRLVGPWFPLHTG